MINKFSCTLTLPTTHSSFINKRTMSQPSCNDTLMKNGLIINYIKEYIDRTVLF